MSAYWRNMTECHEKIIRLAPFEEAIGVLHKLQELDGYFIAEIGAVSVSLPEDMAFKLREMQGKKIGVLRTDCDYRFRTIEDSGLAWTLGKQTSLISVSHNIAYDGGGIENYYGTTIQNGGFISYNTANNYGGAVCNYKGKMIQYGGSIDHNEAAGSGGAVDNYYDTVDLYGGLISYYAAYSYGGGIYNAGGTVNLNGGSLFSNTAYDGGGIDNYYGKVNLNSGSIDHNKAIVDGGGIFNYYGTITGNTALVHDNTLTGGTPDDISP